MIKFTPFQIVRTAAWFLIAGSYCWLGPGTMVEFFGYSALFVLVSYGLRFMPIPILFRSEGSLVLFKRAVKDQKRLVDEHPHHAYHRINLASAHHNLAVAFVKDGKPTCAVKEYLHAIAIFESLLKQHSGFPEYLGRLSQLYNEIGIEFEKMGRTTEARKIYENRRKVDDVPRI